MPSGFYGTRAWRKARQQALHEAGHRCTRCGVSLVGMGRGAQVHHRKPLKRAPALGLEPQNLRALCVGCHKIEEHGDQVNGVERGTDLDGQPTAPGHPWNRGGA